MRFAELARIPSRHGWRAAAGDEQAAFHARQRRQGGQDHPRMRRALQADVRVGQHEPGKVGRTGVVVHQRDHAGHLRTVRYREEALQPGRFALDQQIVPARRAARVQAGLGFGIEADGGNGIPNAGRQACGAVDVLGVHMQGMQESEMSHGAKGNRRDTALSERDNGSGNQTVPKTLPEHPWVNERINSETSDIPWRGIPL